MCGWSTTKLFDSYHMGRGESEVGARREGLEEEEKKKTSEGETPEKRANRKIMKEKVKVKEQQMSH